MKSEVAMEKPKQANTLIQRELDAYEISTDIGSYDAIIPRKVEELNLFNALLHGYIDRAKELFALGNEIDDIDFYISNIHNRKTLEFLWENGKINGFDSKNIMGNLIQYYTIALAEYRKKNPKSDDFKTHGDIFFCEQDIHNKYIGIIDLLLEKKILSVNEVSNYNDTMLMKACQTVLGIRCLAKLAIFLVEKWGADVNFVPKVDAQKERENALAEAENGCMDDVPVLEEYMNTTQMSPLILACGSSLFDESPVDYKERYALCKFLIEHGADVNYTYHYIEFDGITYDECDMTALEVAVESAKIDYKYDKECSSVALLVENKAKITDNVVSALIDISNEEIKEKLSGILQPASGISRASYSNKRSGQI